jgi:HAD superfamily hydrolase (TIGR01509 family)
MSAPRVLLLDLDRTLVNVEPFIDYCAALAELRTILPDWDAPSPDQAWGACTRTAMALLAAHVGHPDWATASSAVERYELAGAAASTPMPGLADFAARLDPSRTGVVTLLTDAGAELALRRHGVPKLACVVGRRLGLRPKPAPDGIEAALAALGAPAAAAVMVGDSEVDEAAARAAGVRFVGVTNGRETHGFGAGSIVVADLEVAAAALARFSLLEA